MCAIAACVLVGPTSALAGGSPKIIRIIYSNDTEGYLQPCSCGGRYLGGLSRRATAISRLTKENPDAVIVESGNLSDKPCRLGIVTKLLSSLKYDAVGVGSLDQQFAPEFFKQTTHFKLPVVDAQRKPGWRVLLPGKA